MPSRKAKPVKKKTPREKKEKEVIYYPIYTPSGVSAQAYTWTPVDYGGTYGVNFPGMVGQNSQVTIPRGPMYYPPNPYQNQYRNPYHTQNYR